MGVVADCLPLFALFAACALALSPPSVLPWLLGVPLVLLGVAAAASSAGIGSRGAARGTARLTPGAGLR